MIKLYDNWLEAEFIARPNRFVMILKYRNKAIKAYVPNTGRMEEFCLPGQIFYLTRQRLPKFDYKVIGTLHQGFFVFLDTIKINTIFQYLLDSNVLDSQFDCMKYRREIALENSRFDFLLSDREGNQKVVEIKSCTLCHNGVAMFPDAPTKRGRRHLEDLEILGTKGYQSNIVYLIAHQGANYFIPNLHTDRRYAEIFSGLKHVSIKALKIHFKDPITLVPEETKVIPIRSDILKNNNLDNGNYLIVMKHKKFETIATGALGYVNYPEGFYVYVGSAMNSLSKRIQRHQRKRKKYHWHIDYILDKMNIVKIFPIHQNKNREHEIASKLMEIADSYISKFGASDSPLKSHLTYFNENPVNNRDFINLILDFRMDLSL